MIIVADFRQSLLCLGLFYKIFYSKGAFPNRVGGRNLLWRRLLIKIIQLGADERRGISTQQPSSLGLAWNLFELMVDSPAHLRTAFAGPGDADKHIQSIAEEALKMQKANDVV